jgi:hypothetical protein
MRFLGSALAEVTQAGEEAVWADLWAALDADFFARDLAIGVFEAIWNCFLQSSAKCPQ